MKLLIILGLFLFFPIPTHAITQDDLLVSVNRERQKIGLSSLMLDPTLDQAAQLKAQDMIARNYWSHNNPHNGKTPWSFILESGYDYQTAGENLGKGFRDADKLVSAWMASPSHRKNILDDRFSQVGVAEVNNIVVLMFANPRAKTTDADTPTIHLAFDYPPLLPLLS